MYVCMMYVCILLVDWVGGFVPTLINPYRTLRTRLEPFSLRFTRCEFWGLDFWGGLEFVGLGVAGGGMRLGFILEGRGCFEVSGIRL